MKSFFSRRGPGILAVGLTWVLGMSQVQAQDAPAEWEWREISTLSIKGKGWQEAERPYGRLPVKAEGMVRPSVWRLSGDSAGLYVEFRSDAPAISVQWDVTRETLALWHMPSVSVSGFDLYVRRDAGWDWLAVGRPKGYPSSESILVENLTPEVRHYRLYFPLYNGLASARIGVPPGHEVLDGQNPQEPMVVFYGTSIVQGACASRAGMAYPALLGRRLGVEAVNLGFSGNGRAEPEVAELLAELSPAVFVLDPLPNMAVEEVAERMDHMVRVIRDARPGTPIVLVENLLYPASKYIESRRSIVEQRNRHLRAVHYRLSEEGVPGVYLISGDRLLGADGLDTVDGVHPTDVGFMRMAEGMEPLLGFLLERN
jgi:lysophospholipase L1-like esterase